MKADKKNALVMAMERGIVSPDINGVFVNARPLPGVNGADTGHLACVQGFRPIFNELKSAGHSVEPQLGHEQQFDQAVLLLGRNRKQNEANIASLWNRLPEGGRLIVAGDKTDGIASIRKWFSKHIDVESFSKFHAVVFWADKNGDTLLPQPTLEKSVDGFHLAEGMFSSGGPDRGSMLLAGHFDERIKGRVADLGAGWGYLSARLLSTCPDIRQIDLFEADYASVEAARENVASADQCTVTHHWIDVATEFAKKPYDWVIMNPPFHTGRASDPGLGQSFIDVAASTLPRGGRLLMVANVNLPYERTLESRFRSFEKLDQQDGYKILQAVK